MTGEMTFDELLTAIEHAWINDKKMLSKKPWDSAVMITTFTQGALRKVCFIFEGVVAMPGGVAAEDPLLDWDGFMGLHDLSHGPNGEKLCSLVMRYDAMNDKFDHMCIWEPGTEYDLYEIGFPKALFESLRPVIDSEDFQPVQERGAGYLTADSQALATAGVRIHKSTVRGDRLEGGWRVYTPLDPEQPRPLPSMDDALEHTVYLVTDTGDVTYTTAPVDEHERLLAELD